MARRPRSRRLRATLLTAAITAGIMSGATAGAQTPAGSCVDGWEVSTIVSGVGNLENLDTDGAGGFYVTGIIDGYLAHIDAAGKFEKLVTGLDHPAGVRVVGRSVYFVTGDGLAEAPGTLRRYDIDTGAVTILLTELNGPNGLLELPDGDLVFATIGINGPPTGISRFRPSTGEYTKTWSNVPWANGLALAPDGKSIYTDNMTLRIFRVPLDDPENPTVVAGAPDLVALLDDMEATRAGQLFVADHIEGAVYRIDPATGTGCTIITGLIKPGPVPQSAGRCHLRADRTRRRRVGAVRHEHGWHVASTTSARGHRPDAGRFEAIERYCARTPLADPRTRTDDRGHSGRCRGYRRTA